MAPSQPPVVNKMYVPDDSEILLFGKYKGVRFGRVPKIDVVYCGWVIQNKKIPWTGPHTSLSRFKLWCAHRMMGGMCFSEDE